MLLVYLTYLFGYWSFSVVIANILLFTRRVLYFVLICPYLFAILVIVVIIFVHKPTVMLLLRPSRMQQLQLHILALVITLDNSITYVQKYTLDNSILYIQRCIQSFSHQEYFRFD